MRILLTLEDLSALLAGRPVTAVGDPSVTLVLTGPSGNVCSACDRPELCRVILPGSQPCHRGYGQRSV